MTARSNKILCDILLKQCRRNPKIVSPVFSNITRNCSQVAKKKTFSLKLSHCHLAKALAKSQLQPALLPAFSKDCKRFDVVQWPKFERKRATRSFKGSVTYDPSLAKNSAYVFKNNDKLNAQNGFDWKVTRYYSSSQKKWGNQIEPEKCPPPKKECYRACPKWQLHNCPPQGDNLNCDKRPPEICCKKKLAPYPSYSEMCAERLEDDPSECMQCPWSRCGGTENLKYPKRKYHTGTSAVFRHFPATMVSPINFAPIQIPPPITCDARKPPCKRPPGKCDKLQKDEPCPIKKKGPCPPPFERKKCEKEKKASSRWTDAYRTWIERNSIAPVTEDWTDITPMRLLKDDECKEKIKPEDVKDDMITPDNSCCLKLPFDEKKMDYEHIRHKQCHKTNCRRKKRKMVPDGCDGKCNKKCAKSLDQTRLYTCYECKKDDDRCTRGDCKRKKCPDINLNIDKRYKPADPCCERALKEMIKGKRHIKQKPFIPDPPNHDDI